MICNAEGTLTAEVAVVGEAPGSEEDRIGRPFVGRSGRLLRNLLEENDVKDVYFTNLAKISPPKGDFSKIYMTGKSLMTWVQELRMELKRLKNLKAILVVGKQASQALIGRDDIMSIRGSIFMSNISIPCIPIIHPAFILRQSKTEGFNLIPITSLDIRKFKKLITEGMSMVPYHKFHFIQTISEFETCFKVLERSKEIAFDIESNRLTKEITVLGFAQDSIHGYAIDMRRFQPNELTYIYLRTKELLCRQDLLVFIQNAQFEKSMMFPYIGDFTCKVFDTMLAHHLCYSTFPKKLGFLVSLYTNEPFYKDEIATDLLKYNCKDTTVTFEIGKVLQTELQDFGLNPLFNDLMTPMVDIVVAATRRGVLVDKDRREEVHNYLKTEFIQLQGRLNVLVKKRYVNVNSPKDVSWLIYQHLGLKHRAGNSDVKVLNDLIVKHQSRELELVLEIRKANKIKSFVSKEFWDEDGRCRCSWNLHGTKTGRFSTTINGVDE